MNAADKGVAAGWEGGDLIDHTRRSFEQRTAPALDTDARCIPCVDSNVVGDCDPVLKAQRRRRVGDDRQLGAVEEEITGGDLRL